MAVSASTSCLIKIFDRHSLALVGRLIAIHSLRLPEWLITSASFERSQGHLRGKASILNPRLSTTGFSPPVMAAPFGLALIWSRKRHQPLFSHNADFDKNGCR